MVSLVGDGDRGPGAGGRIVITAGVSPGVLHGKTNLVGVGIL